MIEPIDERGNLVEQLERHVCAQICRAAYLAGDALESPGELAERLLINPRRVMDAYERLKDRGVVTGNTTDGYIVTDHGVAEARRRLTELAKDQLAQTLAVLRELGLDEAAIDDMIAQAGSRPNGQTAEGRGGDE